MSKEETVSTPETPGFNIQFAFVEVNCRAELSHAFAGEEQILGSFTWAKAANLLCKNTEAPVLQLHTQDKEQMYQHESIWLVES